MHSFMTLSSPRFFDRVSPLLTLVAILGAIGFNTLANFFPHKGANVSQLSNTQFAGVMVTPANYAFAIWGLIYLGLLAFGFYQLQPAQRQNPKLRHTRKRIILASVIQCLWIYLFLDRQFLLSVLAMIGILVCLANAYLDLKAQPRVLRREHWFVYAPISLYFGWITVATVVNVTLGLYSLPWSGGGIPPTAWTVLLMGVSTAIAAIILRKYHDPVYVGVIIWALVAIMVRHHDKPMLLIPGIVMVGGLGGLIWAQQTRRQ
jgi:hypothetical protein